jgi:hypothetical protein
MPLPIPDWLPLSHAADHVAERCNCDIGAARTALVSVGLREGHIRSRCLPQRGFNDPDPLRVLYIEPEEWVRLGINWKSNSLGFAPHWSGGFIHTEVYRPDLDHWLARANPPFQSGVSGRPKHRSRETRDECIRTLRSLDPALLTGNREALLSEVNAKLPKPISKDTLRRALKEINGAKG